MWKLETASKEREIPCKKVISCTGLQDLDGTPVWVLNDQVHINERGKLIDPSCSPYIWINQLVENKLAARVDLSHSKKDQRKALKTLITALKSAYGDNTPAALLTLGAQVLCLHYESLHKFGKFSVPAAILFGKVNAGKSKATKAALSMLGIQECNYIGYATDSKTRSITSQTTLGVVFDDPKDANEISDKILYHFDMAKSCSQAATTVPRCTFLTSMNLDCLHKVLHLHPKYLSRVVLIPFPESATVSPLERWQKDQELSEAMDKANIASYQLIKMKKSLLCEEGKEQFSEILQKVSSVPNLSQRLYMSYSLLLFGTFELLKLAKVKEDYDDDIWKFFNETITPYIHQYQVVSEEDGSIADKSHRGVNDLFLEAVRGERKQTVS
jgi:hypothetical protein